MYVHVGLTVSIYMYMYVYIVLCNTARLEIFQLFMVQAHCPFMDYVFFSPEPDVFGSRWNFCQRSM